MRMAYDEPWTFLRPFELQNAFKEEGEVETICPFTLEWMNGRAPSVRTLGYWPAFDRKLDRARGVQVLDLVHRFNPDQADVVKAWSGWSECRAFSAIDEGIMPRMCPEMFDLAAAGEIVVVCDPWNVASHWFEPETEYLRAETLAEAESLGAKIRRDILAYEQIGDAAREKAKAKYSRSPDVLLVTESESSPDGVTPSEQISTGGCGC